MMRQLTPGRLRAPDCALSLWATLRLMLATFPTEPTQVQLGAWSVVWGLSLLLPAHINHGATTFALPPHVYGWRGTVPAWAWGLAWAGKGAWQVRAALCVARARALRLPELSRARAQCVLAARVNVNLAVALALGFLIDLGPLNAYVAFYAWQAVQQAWVLRRAVVDRRDRTHDRPGETSRPGAHEPDAHEAGGTPPCPP